MAELLSRKKPEISKANRPRLIAILRIKALTAMPCWF